MTEQKQTRAIAELDGLTIQDAPLIPNMCRVGSGGDYYTDAARDAIKQAYPMAHIKTLPPYLNSRDAIVPVIERQPEWIRQEFFYELMKVRGMENMPNGTASVQISITHLQFSDMIISSASQLCEALLRATGKWKE